jgi:hypothetical protein
MLNNQHKQKLVYKRNEPKVSGRDKFVKDGEERLFKIVYSPTNT